MSIVLQRIRHIVGSFTTGTLHGGIGHVGTYRRRLRRPGKVADKVLAFEADTMDGRRYIDGRWVRPLANGDWQECSPPFGSLTHQRLVARAATRRRHKLSPVRPSGRRHQG